MRCITLPERTPALAPFIGTVARLVERGADPGINHIFHVEQMPPVVFEFLLHAKAAPLWGLRPRSLVGLWSVRLGSRSPGLRLLGQSDCGSSARQQKSTK